MCRAGGACAKLNRTEFGIALATLVATVTIRLEMAILLGTILSLVAYLYRTSKPAMRTMGFDTPAPERPFVVIDDNPAALPECPQLKLLRMEGSVYFGATQHVADTLHALREEAHAPKHLLVMAKSMNFIDVAGADVWEVELQQRRAMGGDLYFHRPRPQVVEMWERTRFIQAMGRDHIFPDKRTAIGTIFDEARPAHLRALHRPGVLGVQLTARAGPAARAPRRCSGARAGGSLARGERASLNQRSSSLFERSGERPSTPLRRPALAANSRSAIPAAGSGHFPVSR